MHKAKRAALEYTFKRDDLLARYPELASDEQALLDTLEGETDIHKALEYIIRQYDEREIWAAGLALKIEQFTERMKRHKRAMEQIKSLLEEIVIKCGHRFELDSATLSLSATKQKVIISDEKLIPPKYKTAPEPEPDKKLIKDALDAGKPVPGATLSNGGQHLVMRRK